MTSSWRFHNSTTSTGAIAALFSLHSFNSSMLLGLLSLVSARRARLVLTLDILWLCVEAKKETKFKLLHNAALYKRLERAPEMLLTIMPEKMKKRENCSVYRRTFQSSTIVVSDREWKREYIGALGGLEWDNGRLTRAKTTAAARRRFGVDRTRYLNETYALLRWNFVLLLLYDFTCMSRAASEIFNERFWRSDRRRRRDLISPRSYRLHSVAFVCCVSLSGDFAVFFISHPTNLTCLRHHKSMILIWLRAQHYKRDGFPPNWTDYTNRKFHWSSFLLSFEKTHFSHRHQNSVLFSVS